MESVKFIKIGVTDEEKERMKLDIIGNKKKMNKIISESRKNSKSDKCAYCGEETSSFCNSHSIPAFCLRNIATEGKLYYSNTLIDLPLLESEKGVNKSGTFQLICRKCDGVIFQDYEDPENYKEKPTNRMIAQIAMKNYLKFMSKRIQENAMYDMGKNINSEYEEMLSLKQQIGDIDFKEYKKGFEKAKRVSKKDWNNEYYLFYYEKLEYVVPIAFQGSIALVCDLDGNIVNDIYESNPKYRMEDLHICVFPLESSSVVMMFIDSKDKRYRNFYKKFNKLEFEDKLALVNYIIFLYSEDVFFSKQMPQEVLKDKKLIDVMKTSGDALSLSPMINIIDKAKEIYNLDKRHSIPNLLSKKYKLK